MEKVAKELCVMEEKVREKLTGFFVTPGQQVMTVEEAATKTETELGREQFAVLVDNWTTHSQLIMKKEFGEALKMEVQATATRSQDGRVKGSVRGGN